MIGYTLNGLTIIFAMIGVAWVLLNIIFPFVRIFLYAIGYCIFNVWTWDKELLKKLIKEHGWIKFIFFWYKLFLNGLSKGYHEGWNEEYSYEKKDYKYIWKPLFCFKKTKKVIE